ncbi:hypothetical protein PVK64_12360 [Aliivibrio sp. S4TY2]|uniref:hypothetical protein n=1 Tax=unclassified Aliivibrio TaxID=2645654 RepID=UPI002379DE40|nr:MULTISPECIES: hypothetical protein [unclassified Aliivibrio]MDD9156969.1 hypothetical protein [Aliivibrio sp. S4TY2]MDD9160817.1 hypothetical protein [Aliivibrio sp. S4TY1]MDD9164846.1 hypothetical protein [Aliivibrio sp. S4MY2]MDD9168879.1 hypothetical protein [Aliivibrio sp. S4MY4]MDD9185407.1 hypothetical protein [Aliivibrio sp. S4MY3]
MHDFREERYFKVYLVLFITNFCGKNNNGRNILTLKKLEIIYFLIQNPAKFKEFCNLLNLGNITGYKPTLYDQSVSLIDYLDLDNIKLTVCYLINIGKLKYTNVKGIQYIDIVDDGDSDFFTDSYELLTSNINKLKKITSMTEPKLLKSLMGL